MPSPEPAPRTRRARLRMTANDTGVPLPTILVTVGVVAGTILIGLLAYELRTILLLIAVAGFLALVLNPFVLVLSHRGVPRGVAISLVVVLGAAAFLGLAAAFGFPLSRGLAHLARQLPVYVNDAERGRGVIGRVARQLHLQHWVIANAPKLQQLGVSLAKPALSFGKGAAVLIGELLAILTLAVMLLVEGPRLRAGLLSAMSEQHAAWWARVGREMRQSVVGYVLGDLLTSVIAGLVVGLTMAGLGLPFAQLWGLWVALVDFLPQVGGALAGIPTVIFALLQSLEAGIILAVVFIAYQQVENHVLNPWIMSRTVRTSPILILISVLVGATLGAALGGAFGAFVAALLAVPVAAVLQILGREVWQLTGRN